MNTRTAIPVLAGLLLAPGGAAAQQSPGDLRQVYQMGKDIARLEQEMKELRQLLQQLLELDRERVALLSRAVGGREVSVSSGRVRPLAAPSSRRSRPGARQVRQSPVRPTRGSLTRGTVGGRVSLPSGVATAYVYVENLPRRRVNRTIEIAQKNKQFAPRWAVIQIGTTVKFPNLDSIYHNVFSRSQSAAFDLGIYRSGDRSKSFVFTKPGTVEIFCNMHSKMKAEILVVPNSAYTRIGSDGAFTLKNVPRGRRKIVAWGPDTDPIEKSITVRGGEASSVVFELKRRRAKKHLNKYNQPYGSYE